VRESKTLVGSSRQLDKVKTMLLKLATKNFTVVCGETTLLELDAVDLDR
jgi:hypothetical protein